MTFTHLEVHSNMTLLAATPTVAQLAGRAAADGMTHLALTDTNALYAAVAFKRACRAAGVQPIIGMTLTVEPPDLPGAASPPAEMPPGHLVLLAKNATGYRSLCRLATLVQGRPDREEVAARGLAWEEVTAQRAGVICLSGGRAGWVERLLRAGDRSAARALAGRLAGTFGEDAYLALELHAAADAAVAAEIASIAGQLGMPLAAVQPVYTLAAADAWKLRVLAAIRENRRVAGYEDEDAREEADEEGEDDPEAEHASGRGNRVRATEREESPAAAAPPRQELAETTDVYWLTPAEMRARFAGYTRALEATGEIAARCGDALPDGRPIWPALKLPAGQTPADALAELARAGLAQRYPVNPPAERLAHELSTIAQHGYSPLFLVVADIVRFAREKGVPVSTRGSVANSLVAYCTAITTVDPIEHGLLFERFLNPARANPPDIDLDFCSVRRDEVLRYVRDHYGADHVALVCTVSTLRLQSAVREVGKAYGLSEEVTGKLADMMPSRWHPDPRRRDTRTIEDILPLIADERQREVVRAAASLVGTPDHLSIHPGGVVITPGPLTDVTPLQWTPKGFLVTQYEHGDVEQIGLPKLDLLGIRALTVLADAAELVRSRYEPAFDLEAIPLNDAATGDIIARGETIGVFQCESAGAQRTLRKLKARHVRDMAVANAFFKPGPAMGGMADAFVRRYRGEERVKYLHPALEPILGPTKGVLIFQEQVLRLATEVAGLSWAQADHLRRGMSHFGKDEMDAMREAFVTGCQRAAPAGPAFTPAQAATLWEQVIPFSGYGFNQGHATAYAAVSYRSAYLKTHFTAAFCCARLRGWGGYHHPAVYMAEAVRLGIPVRAPHVNFSEDQFALVDRVTVPTLYQGLGQVRDLRGRAVTDIVAGRTKGLYRDLRDLLGRVALQPKEVDHLIRCGALDGLGENRASLLAEAETLRKRGGTAQLAFEFARPAVVAETLAQRWAWEQELLGIPISALTDPLALVRAALPPHSTIREAMAAPGRALLTAGVRLPGWTGGPGFFLSDGERFVICRAGKETRTPTAWRPLLVRGRWAVDAWGGAWLQASAVDGV